MDIGEIDRFRQRCIEIGHRVHHQLNDIFATVGIGAGILQRGLIVVGRFEKTRRPGVKAVVAIHLVGVGCAVAVGVDEEVGMAGRLIDNRRTGYIAGIGLDRLIEQFAYSLHLVIDAFFHVTIAVVIDFGAGHAHVAQLFNRRHPFVTVGAGFDLDL